MDARPTLNVDLLLETLAYIEAHPEEHDQASWRCGTATCFAGHAATLAGGRWCTCDDSRCDYVEAVSTDHHAHRHYDPPEHALVTPVSARARQVLGLTEGEAIRLFLVAKDLTELRDAVASIIASYTLEYGPVPRPETVEPPLDVEVSS